MTYLVAWLIIGFTCSLIGNSYNTKEVYKRKIQKYLSRKGMKPEDVPVEVTYETYKMFCFVTGIIYGVFNILCFYDIRREYIRLQKKKK